jgi:hypothetical protein
VFKYSSLFICNVDREVSEICGTNLCGQKERAFYWNWFPPDETTASVQLPASEHYQSLDLHYKHKTATLRSCVIYVRLLASVINMIALQRNNGKTIYRLRSRIRLNPSSDRLVDD